MPVISKAHDNAGPSGSNSDFKPGKFSRDRGKAWVVCQRGSNFIAMRSERDITPRICLMHG